jgi:hypothetical protein
LTTTPAIDAVPEPGALAGYLARALHDPALTVAYAVGAGPGLVSAAGLLVDNERLQAELHKQLAELRESRTRLVERADAERRALERDLHDGAQQRLLAEAEPDQFDVPVKWTPAQVKSPDELRRRPPTAITATRSA